MREVLIMLEYRLEPEDRLLVCTLGTLGVGGGQIVECSLCLSDVLPERRVALAVELPEGEQLRDARLYTVSPHHEDGPAGVWIEGIRFYLPDDAGPEGLTLRSDAHYIDQGDRCVLP